MIILPVYYAGVENEVDDTSYTADKPVFERIIADITNSSESEVESSFVEMLSSITKIGPRIGRSLNWKSKRSNGNRALINVVVIPRNKIHEAFVVSKMSLSISLRDEINLELKNRPTENGVSVERVNPITRKSGIGFKLYCFKNYVAIKYRKRHFDKIVIIYAAESTIAPTTSTTSTTSTSTTTTTSTSTTSTTSISKLDLRFCTIIYLRNSKASNMIIHD